MESILKLFKGALFFCLLISPFISTIGTAPWGVPLILYHLKLPAMRFISALPVYYWDIFTKLHFLLNEIPLPPSLLL